MSSAHSHANYPSYFSKLEELYLSHNSIKRLTVVPQRFPALQVLDLSHNQIQNDKELVSVHFLANVQTFFYFLICYLNFLCLFNPMHSIHLQFCGNKLSLIIWAVSQIVLKNGHKLDVDNYQCRELSSFIVGGENSVFNLLNSQLSCLLQLCLSECECLRELDLSNNPFDLDEQGRVATNPAEIIPTLQVLDRVRIINILYK